MNIIKEENSPEKIKELSKRTGIRMPIRPVTPEELDARISSKFAKNANQAKGVQDMLDIIRQNAEGDF